MLTLTLLASPDLLSPSTRQIPDGSFSLGRAADNDWMLPDPERHLSKRHCMFDERDGFWVVTDLSTNGTFLNEEADPIGHGQVRDLRDGDQLRLGAYAFALRITAARPSAPLPLAMPRDETPFVLSGQPDHSPSVEDAFRPPQPVVLLDDDWDLCLDGGSNSNETAGDEWSEPEPRAAALPQLDPAVARDEMAAPLPCAVPLPIASGPSPTPHAHDLLAAFLRGAGLRDAHPADPAMTMEILGTVFRALVSGLRETLIARAAVKDEFRIAQTVIRAHGNNPLKFAATDDDALLALLGTGRRTDMRPDESVQEALRDIRLHELTTMAAMQSAVRTLLREFAPAKLREEAGGFGVLPQQRKARAWDRFEALHTRLTQALSDDFDSAFGRAFARAYEQAQTETRGQGTRE
ncbi:MAG: type VI secretion system-associated FHA domain protein TagH [Acetobacteraceae bacterium]